MKIKPTKDTLTLAKELIIKHLPEKKDKVASIKDIHAGYTNYSYLVTFDDGSKVQIRIPHCGDLINRHNEYAILNLLKDENFIYFDPKTGVAIKKWIEGTCPLIPKLTKWNHLDELFTHIKQIHKTELPKGNKLNKISLDVYNQHLYHLKFIYQKKYLCIIDRHRDDKLVLNHTDINALNIIIDENKKLHLIDFEWASLAPDYWDYANFIRESDIHYNHIEWNKYIENFDMQTLQDYLFITTVYAYLWTWAMPQSTKILKYRKHILKRIRKYYKGVETKREEYCNEK